jgi:hypothetical protein
MTTKDKMYNEMYFYNLFLKYYSSTFEIYKTTLSLKTATSDLQEVVTFN